MADPEWLPRPVDPVPSGPDAFFDNGQAIAWP